MNWEILFFSCNGLQWGEIWEFYLWKEENYIPDTMIMISLK